MISFIDSSTATRSKYFKPRSDAMRLEHSKAPVTKYPVLGHYTEAPKPNDTKDVKVLFMICLFAFTSILASYTIAHRLSHKLSVALYCC